MKRTLVIGDIHGGLKALVQVLERASVSTEDELIFLGDYVDGWSESAQVIDFLIDRSVEQSCIFIKGNHDAWCENWLRTGTGDSDWIFHGGQSTIESYAKQEKNAAKHLEFFERMTMYYIDESNRLFIHAGFTSMHGPQNEFYSTNYRWDRTLLEMALAINPAIDKSSILYPKRLKLFHEIYIGHTPTINYNSATPIQAVNLWNIDTGSAFTGKLTILDVDSKQFWQSDPLPQLYPNESGRNKS